MYKLSPSDFAYLYEECKPCYVLKIKYGIEHPSKPMPAVFGALNSRLQGALVGRALRELSPLLPEGIVESQECFVELKPVPGANAFPPKWLPVEIVSDTFRTFMAEVSGLLEGLDAQRDAGMQMVQVPPLRRNPGSFRYF